SRREIRRHDLCRRGACGRHVRPARRRHRRARRRHAPHRRARRHAREGVRLPRRLYRRQGRDHRRRALPCARLPLHHPPPPPPPSSAAAPAATRPLKASNWERERPQERAARVKAILNAAGLPVMSNDTHIVPLFVGDAVKCKQASDMLLEEHGIYIQPINYPTVAKGTERLRITPSPYHEDALIDQLAEALLQVWERLALPLKEQSLAAE